MKNAWGAGVVGLSLLLSGVAQAGETGVELGIRSGYALPLGTSAEDEKLGDLVAGVVPLWFDLGYRVTPNVMVGAYFQYGFGIFDSRFDETCDVLDCSLNNMRLGVQAHYHFLPWEQLDPWIGLGIGYEWLSISQKGTATALGQTLSVDRKGTAGGFEFVNLQAGLDMTPAEDTHFAFGPFIALSVAQYATTSETRNGQSESEDIEDKGIHEWLTLGVRGTFVP